MIILGLNAFHADSAAALVRDGVLIAAAEEERFRRVKHWAGFPSQAINYCLREAKVDFGDITHVAVNRSSRANLFRKLSYVAFARPSPRLLLKRWRNRQQVAHIADELRALPGRPFAGTIDYVEHHLAHLASAFYPSPFRDATVVSVDGFGDFASAAWGCGHETSLSLDGRMLFPHSLGIFYQAMTQYLGFPHYGDEYKMMGLAPYGEPKYLAEMRRMVRLQDDGTYELDLQYFRHHRDKVEYEWEGGSPVVGALYSAALAELLGPARAADAPLEQRHRDLARSAQAMYEEAFFHLLRRLHERYRLDALCLSGGCAMNSVANGKVYRETPFRRLYVQSAAGDAGGAIGAAFVAWSRIGKSNAQRRFLMDHAYWGPAFPQDELRSLLGSSSAELRKQGCSVAEMSTDSELCSGTAT